MDPSSHSPNKNDINLEIMKTLNSNTACTGTAIVKEELHIEDELSSSRAKKESPGAPQVSLETVKSEIAIINNLIMSDQSDDDDEDDDEISMPKKRKLSFKCTSCSMCLPTLNELEKHIKKHTSYNNKTWEHKCERCDMRFERSEHLNRHMLTHIGDNVYNCDLCSSSFSFVSEWRKHCIEHKTEDAATRKRNLTPRQEKVEKHRPRTSSSPVTAEDSLTNLDKLDQCDKRSNNMTDYQAFISKQIATGVYTLSQRHNGRSLVWNVLSEIVKEDETLIKGYVYCNVCRKLLSYNSAQTSNLNRHKCCLALKQPQFLKNANAEDKLNAIDVCTNWAIEDCHPLSTLHGSGFIKLINFFIKIGAIYGDNVDVNDLLPDLATISHKLQQAAQEKRNELKSEIKEIVNSGGASATIDFWTDNYVQRHFFGITLHYEQQAKLFDITLGMKSIDLESATDENVFRKVKSLFKKFDVQNLATIKFITDRGKNIMEALEHITRLNCSSHLFTNVLEQSFNEIKELTSMLTSCKEILKYLNRENFDLPITLKSQSSTRWSSNYIILKTVAVNWEYINELLSDYGTTPRLQGNVSTLKNLIELCKIFDIVFQKLQRFNAPSLCIVLPSIYKIKNLCAPNSADSSAISKFKNKIIQNTDDIWLKNLSIYHKAALFLYPPAATMQIDDICDIKNFCVSQIEKLAAPTSSIVKSELNENTAESSIISNPESPATHSTDSCSNFSTDESFEKPTTSYKNDIQFFFPELLGKATRKSLKSPEEEVERYSRELVKLTEDFDVLKWWSKNANNYPHLSKVALQIHAIPASNTAAERAFSLASSLINEKRHRLGGPNTIDNLLFLHSYFKNSNN